MKLRTRHLPAALALTAAIALSGCKTMPTALGGGAQPAANLTPAEQRMRQDEQRFNDTVWGGVATGAAIGAVGGAVIAAIGGGNSKDVARGAVIGGVAGGVIGGVDGYVTAKKEQAGNNEVRAIQSAAADVRADNQKLESFVASSNAVLAEGRQRLASLRGDVAAKRITAQQAEQARKREEQNIASMNNALAQAKKSRDQYQQAAQKISNSPQAKRDLDSEIGRMNQQVAALENNIRQYNEALLASKA